MIPAVVLAAGLSTRMGGEPKGLLPFDARDTFVTRIVRTFVEAGITEIVVVVGHDAPRVRAVLEASRLPVQIIENAAYQQGQFSSLLAGLDAVARPGVEAMLLTLVDAPLFAASTVEAVVRRFNETRSPVVRAVRGSEHGHPVLIARSLFAAIRACDPKAGAKSVVRGHASEAGDVPVDDAGAYIDIDTPAEYAALPELRRQLGW